MSTEAMTPADLAASFAAWAESKGLLTEITEDECRRLADAWMAGFSAGTHHGVNLGADAFEERLRLPAGPAPEGEQ